MLTEVTLQLCTKCDSYNESKVIFWEECNQCGGHFIIDSQDRTFCNGCVRCKDCADIIPNKMIKDRFCYECNTCCVCCECEKNGDK